MPRARLGRRLAAVIIAASWMLPLRPALATGPEPTEPAADDEPHTPDPEQDAALEEARNRYEEGRVLYSAADYKGAIEAFKDTMRILSTRGVEFAPETRGRLLYNLATAHSRAYNIDRDPTHLRTAIELFERIESEAEGYGYSPDLVAESRTGRETTVARLEELEKKEEAVTVPPDPEPVPDPKSDSDEQRRLGTRLAISGGVLTALGVVGLGIMGGGFGMGFKAEDDIDDARAPSREGDRIDAMDRAATARGLVIGGAVAGGVLLVTGAVLLGVGLSRRKRANTVACMPTASPALAGAGCMIRF